jgi:hypothetical protein
MKKTPKKLQKKYNCCPCSFASNNLNDFNRHNSTTKHERTINAIFGLTKKTPKIHNCKSCGKKYKHCSSLSKHLKICKKQKGVLSKVIQSYPKVIHRIFVCECKKSYKFASGLSKHKKMCKHLQHGLNKNKSYVSTVDGVVPLLKKMDEKINVISKQNVDISKQNVDISKQNTALFIENKILKEKILSLELGTTINNNGDNYTINMFLNDKCKNAMNLEDFVEKIKFTLEDLKYTADNGFTDGISNVFIKNLNDLEVTERPIHCTDQKRLQFYVKNEDVWEKDDANLTNSIEQMSKKQGSSINEWTRANPDYLKSEKKRDEYFKIVNETMKSTDCKNIKNIKKNVSRNVKLEKKDM